jgi:hypothetical protein
MEGDDWLMGVSVDERVVSMRFDNNQFLNGADQVIQKLAILKTALNFSGVSQGLQDVSNSIKNWSFDAMQQGMDSIAMKFSFLDTLAMNFFKRVSDKVLDTATNLGKMATGIEGMGDGFAKYGEKTRAVQTILTAVKDKGYDLEAVNNVLDDMNWFTDETSYNFTEMTNTIGKFTSAGVDLIDAKNAVQGIALWAAESGQNAGVASRAMYQLSQAYGTGTIKLQDWMSIEQANMSTAKIQNLLIEEGGKKAEQAVKKYQGFRNSLQSGWLTTEIFTKVMKKYSEGVEEANWENGEFTGGVTELSKAAFAAAQEARTWSDVVDALKDAVSTGWMHTWEYLFGNKDEASEFFTNVANGLIEVSDYFTELRNNGIETWYELGGRSSLVESIYSIWGTLGSLANSVIDAINSVINPVQTLEQKMSSLLGLSDEGDKIISDIKHVKDLMASGLIPEDVGQDNLKSLEEQLDRISSGKGLFKITRDLKNFADDFKNAFDPGQGSQYYSQKIDGLNKQLDAFKNANKDLLSVGSLGYKKEAEGLKSLIKDEKSTQEYIATFRENNEKYWKDAALAKLTDKQIVEKLREQIKNTEELQEKAYKAERTVKDIKGEILETEDRLAQSNVAEGNLGELQSIIRGVTAIIHTAVSAVTGFVRAIMPMFAPIVTVGKSLFYLFGAIGEFIVALTGASEEGNKFYNVFKVIVDYILPPFTQLCETLSGWITELTNNFEEWTDSVTKGEGPISKFISDTMKTLRDVGKFLSEFFTNLFSGKVTLDEIKNAVVGFFVSFANNSGPLVGILKNLWDILSGFGKALLGVFVDMDPVEEGGFRILSLAEVLERAGKLIGNVAGGLVNGLIGIFTGIGESVKKLNLKSIMKLIKGLAISEGVLSIAGFLRELSGVAKEVKKVFGLFNGLFDKNKITDIISIFKGIGLAFLALAGSLFIIALIPSERLGPSIGALSLVMLELVGVFATMALISKYVNGGQGYALDGMGDMFLSMALSLVVIAFAIKLIGGIGFTEFVQGLAGVALIMWSLAAVGKWLTGDAEATTGFSFGKFAIGSKKTGKEMMAGSAGFIIMAIAIRIIAGAVKMIGSQNPDVIEQGLKGFVIILGSLVAVGVALTKFNVSGLNMIGIALSMQMMGLALLEIAGVIAILGSLDTDKSNQGIGSFITTLAAIAVAMAVLSNVTNGLNVIGISVGLILLGTAMGIFAAEIAVLGSLSIDTLVKGIGALAATLLILGIAGAVMAPVLPVLLGLAVVIAIFSGGLLIASLGIVAFAGAFSVLADVIGKHAAEMSTGMVVLATGFTTALLVILRGIVDAIPLITDVMANLVAALISGFLGGLANSTSALIEGGFALLMAFLGGIANNIGQIVVTAGLVIVNFINGLAQMLPAIIVAGFNLLTSFIEGMALGLSQNSQKIFDALGLLLDSIGIFIMTGLYNLVKGIPVVGDEVKKIIDDMQADLDSKVSSTTVAESVPDIPAQVAGSIENSSSNEQLTAAGSSMMDKVMSGLTDGANMESLTGIGGDITSSISSGITDSPESIEAITGAGVSLTDMFSKSVIDQKESAKPAGSELAQAGSDGAGELVGEYETTGSNLGKGIATGLTSSESLNAVIEQSKKLVRAGIDAANKEGKISSPSKETYKTGKWLVLGAVNGLKDFSYALEDSAATMSSNVVGTMSSALLSIYDFNDNLAGRSVIRPVLDLTNVKSGTNSVEDMLSSSSIKEFAEASINIDSQRTQMDSLVEIASNIFKSIQNGSDVVLDGKIITGYVNRRLGQA